MYKLSDIAAITGCETAGSPNHSVNVFLTDSRNLLTTNGVLFAAIVTPKNDGHKYLHFLATQGVKSFLVQKKEFSAAIREQLLQEFPDCGFLICENTIDALQTLAKHHRRQFQIPVIGITGSNGKTVVKEWLYQLLKHKYSICRSPKSYNSQLGVPLSVLNLQSTHTLAIFEAGISQTGEMEKLENIIQPDIAVITSIGSAHEEGFRSRDEKVKEKFALLSHAKTVIYPHIEGISVYGNKNEIIVSPSGLGNFNYSFNSPNLTILSQGVERVFKLPFTDQASIQNTATCIAVLLHLGLKTDEISNGIAHLQPVALRLEMKNAIGNSLLINDFYNSDLDSLKIALNFLQQQNRKTSRSLILSDIEQSGLTDTELYREIAQLVSIHNIDQLIGIGKKISSFRPLFKSNSEFFENTSELSANFHRISHKLSNSTILLKGARSFGFEVISNILQQKSHDTVLEVDLSKLASNIAYYRMQLAPEVKLMCMVKAMGYGGGGSELASTLQHLGVNYLAVAYADEGVDLRLAQIHLPIMVMSPESDSYEDMINHRLEPELYSFRVLEEFIKKLDVLGISSPYPVHIKIDTGMNRLGFEPEQVAELVNKLKQSPQIKVQSVFSHLAGSDNPRLDEFSKQQIKTFNEVCHALQQGIGSEFIRHICNSGGISRFPDAHLDMVRLGIGMHGIGVNEPEQKQLQNVSSLKTRISQIKSVKKGESVGYNRNGIAEEDILIATIPIGYADGFGRVLGNGKFFVSVNGVKCPTVGNICMDMCMINVTKVQCKEGDEVIIFNTVDQLKELAEAMNTISYEVLTSVSGRVKRIYIQE